MVWRTDTEIWYGEVVWKLGSFHGVPLEYHEKSVWKISLVECHEECVGVSAHECGESGFRE